MVQTVLILGATGRFGRNAAAAFAAAGWQVRRFERKADTLSSAVQGVDVIVNAWNPAYPDWAAQVPGLHTGVIAAARSVDATVIVPGNVYVFGAGTPAPWSVASPHAAANPLGRIRRDMERAYRDSGVRTILLRAGDFIDTAASGNWFDQIMIARLARGVFTYPGQPDIAHAWAYLPDLARAAVALAERRDTLDRFEDIAFPGYTLTGQEIAAHLAQITGRSVRLKKMNWLPIRLAQPVWKLARSLCEMRYLWNTPHSLDGERFEALLPGFEATAVARALATALGSGPINPAPLAPNPRNIGGLVRAGHSGSISKRAKPPG
ncbi:Rossmann-fold NAD(P)-binding domain-containing protein [Thiosulfatihalobacter marinus]|uniref:sugar nucleotide-binding protein n=1 Tax=Thiosulfatihalobacter marinus TaxID=2792481 RepID=UPI0018D67288|nr:sugar nucleotide-binding protein [Thiosulfatihalobacter marinus]